MVPAAANSLRDRAQVRYGSKAVPDPLDLGRVDVLPTGSFCLDHSFGIGGYPRARITSFAGPPHAGKTALCLFGIAAAQQHIQRTEGRPARILIVDSENAYSEGLANIVECDTDPEHMVVMQPLMIESALEMVMMGLGFETKDKGRTWQQVDDAYDVVMLDSWAGSATEGVGLAELARIGAAWFPTIAGYVRMTNAAMFVCNHIREKPGVMFGNPEYEPGGNAYKHARSLGLMIHRTDVLRDGYKNEIGHDLKVEIVKNKCSAYKRKSYLHLNYTTGFDHALDVVRFFDMIGEPLKPKADGTIYEFGKLRENGEKNFVEALRNDLDTLVQLCEIARVRVRG